MFPAASYSDPPDDDIRCHTFSLGSYQDGFRALLGDVGKVSYNIIMGFFLSFYLYLDI